LQEEDVGDLELPDDLKLEEGDDGGGEEGGDEVDSNDGSDGDGMDEPQDVDGDGDDKDDNEGEDENAPVELEELEQEVCGLKICFCCLGIAANWRDFIVIDLRSECVGCGRG
jgi:hypothetical protein